MKLPHPLPGYVARAYEDWANRKRLAGGWPRRTLSWESSPAALFKNEMKRRAAMRRHRHAPERDPNWSELRMLFPRRMHGHWPRWRWEAYDAKK